MFWLIGRNYLADCWSWFANSCLRLLTNNYHKYEGVPVNNCYTSTDPGLKSLQIELLEYNQLYAIYQKPCWASHTYCTTHATAKQRNVIIYVTDIKSEFLSSGFRNLSRLCFAITREFKQKEQKNWPSDSMICTDNLTITKNKNWFFLTHCIMQRETRYI